MTIHVISIALFPTASKVDAVLDLVVKDAADEDIYYCTVGYSIVF